MVLPSGRGRTIVRSSSDESLADGGAEVGVKNRRVQRALQNTTSSDPVQRCEALWKLTYRHMPRRRLSGRQRRLIAARMARLAQRDPSADVREAAVHGLRWTRGIDPIGVFLSASADPDPAVRGQALAALGGRALGRCAAAWSRRETIQQTLRCTLADHDPAVRFWSVFAIGQLRLPELREETLALVDDPASGGCGDRTVGELARTVCASLPTS